VISFIRGAFRPSAGRVGEHDGQLVQLGLSWPPRFAPVTECNATENLHNVPSSAQSGSASG